MWKIQYHPKAYLDLKQLDKGQRNIVLAKIRQVADNPLPANQGGYGEPLGSRNKFQLSGYYKIKYLKLGLRAVYTLNRSDKVMLVVVIAVRRGDEVYRIAQKRKQATDSR